MVQYGPCPGVSLGQPTWGRPPEPGLPPGVSSCGERHLESSTQKDLPPLASPLVSALSSHTFCASHKRSGQHPSWARCPCRGQPECPGAHQAWQMMLWAAMPFSGLLLDTSEEPQSSPSRLSGPGPGRPSCGRGSFSRPPLLPAQLQWWEASHGLHRPQGDGGRSSCRAGGGAGGAVWPRKVWRMGLSTTGSQTALLHAPSGPRPTESWGRRGGLQRTQSREVFDRGERSLVAQLHGGRRKGGLQEGRQRMWHLGIHGWLEASKGAFPTPGRKASPGRPPGGAWPLQQRGRHSSISCGTQPCPGAVDKSGKDTLAGSHSSCRPSGASATSSGRRLLHCQLQRALCSLAKLGQCGTAARAPNERPGCKSPSCHQRLPAASSSSYAKRGRMGGELCTRP